MWVWVRVCNGLLAHKNAYLIKNKKYATEIKKRNLFNSFAVRGDLGQPYNYHKLQGRNNKVAALWWNIVHFK